MAITFGMSTREFWEEDPELLWAYRKSYIDKIKLQQEIDNFNAWLNGLYVYIATGACLSGFSKEGAKPYIAKPYDFSKTAEEQIIEEREDKIKEQLRRGKKVLQNKGVGK